MNAISSRFPVRVFTLIILISFFASFTAYAQFDGGNGTEEDPWQIATVEQLQSISEHPEAHFILIMDIDASETANWNGGLGLEPIGDSDSRFSGSLDGKGLSITGLTINRENQNGVGLFGVVQNGELRNVTLTDAQITGRNNTGGLAGMFDGGSIHHSAVSGTIAGNNYTGGLTGSINRSILQQSYTHAVVSGESGVGGLTRSMEMAEITNCYSLSEVNGQSMAGGLFGYVLSVGFYSDEEAAVLDGSYAAGPVHGEEYIGGLVGFIEWVVLTKADPQNEGRNFRYCGDSNKLLGHRGDRSNRSNRIRSPF
ncbi:hypothetical protein BH23BAC3_BH23BAC3_23580 [soil metagenome]